MKLKTEILDRDLWACYLCGEHAELVDHKIPIAEGGARWDAANLGAMCTDCHETKSKAEAARGSRRYAQAKRNAEK